MNINNLSIAGIVLAGGKGSRMGGIDKGLYHYRSQRLIEHAIKAVAVQVDKLLISANRNLDIYKAYGHTVIHDTDASSFDGPMAGIAQCLIHLNDSKHTHALVSCCDTPNIPTFMAQRLLQTLSSSTKAVATVHDGERRQNLHCLIKRSAWPSLIKFYQNGGRAMHRWQTEIEYLDVDFSDCSTAFKNINRPVE